MVEATRQEVAVLCQLEEATERVEQLHLRVVQGKAAAAAQREAEEREGAEAVAALVAAAEGAWEQQGAWQQVRAPGWAGSLGVPGTRGAAVCVREGACRDLRPCGIRQVQSRCSSSLTEAAFCSHSCPCRPRLQRSRRSVSWLGVPWRWRLSWRSRSGRRRQPAPTPTPCAAATRCWRSPGSRPWRWVLAAWSAGCVCSWKGGRSVHVAADADAAPATVSTLPLPRVRAGWAPVRGACAPCAHWDGTQMERCAVLSTLSHPL